jgi:tol-pal system protein YbgF
MILKHAVHAFTLAVFLAGCSPAQYFAQPASVEETRDTVRALKTQQDELLKRITALEKELASQTGRLAENNANLNAELGTLGEALQTISDRLNDMSGQLDRRPVARAVPVPVEPDLVPAPATPMTPPDTSEPAGNAPTGAIDPGPSPGEASGLDPEEVYDTAYRDVSRGSYTLAVAGFREFLRLFPDHSLADNAQYWIGECFYVQNDMESASTEFRRVIDGYPDGDKVPAAYLKLGYAALRLNNTNEARRHFDELIQKYPRSEESRSARTKLASLN